MDSVRCEGGSKALRDGIAGRERPQVVGGKEHGHPYGTGGVVGQQWLQQGVKAESAEGRQVNGSPMGEGALEAVYIPLYGGHVKAGSFEACSECGAELLQVFGL